MSMKQAFAIGETNLLAKEDSMPFPEMHPVSSSNIASVGYDPAEEAVYVEFLSGSVYIYKGVLQHEFENLLTAASVGSYLNRNYKNIYPYERIQ